MSARDQEILKATGEAARVLAHIDNGSRTSVDIIGLVSALEIPLMFRPLEGLWGASVIVDDEHCGILVTTALDLSVQRFTLAHELGHILMGHKTSFDKTTGFTGRYGPVSIPTQEIAADTFASELLAPKSLILSSARRHQWKVEQLKRPEIIYQLSLRLGISYIATCWALVSRKILTAAQAKKLSEKVVKDIKLGTVPKKLITNSWANTWTLTAGDSGTYLEASPEDIFAVHLKENASSGFIWQLVNSNSSAKIIDEITQSQEEVGSRNGRILFVQFTEPGTHRLTFEHVRPWNKSSIEHIDINIDSNGKEHAGYSRFERAKLLSEVVA
jgi:Zn-dependent peptidase ImmA (M78 family)